jgi:hypothetical protein
VNEEKHKHNAHHDTRFQASSTRKNKKIKLMNEQTQAPHKHACIQPRLQRVTQLHKAVPFRLANASNVGQISKPSAYLASL